MSTCLLYILGLLSLLFQSTHALYTEESIIISVDVTIKTVSPLLDKANANIPHIIQTSFQNTNRDASYLYIIPISNLTFIGHDNSFRYNALLNVYFVSESEYAYAITKYEDTFSNDMSNFIQKYQSNIYNALLRTLNVDSLGSNAVTINSLNMIQGHFIVNYVAKKRTPTAVVSTIHPNAMNMRVTSDPDSYIKDNIVFFLIIGGTIMFVCFCCTIGCFWCSDRVQKSDAQKKQNMLETEALKLHQSRTNPHKKGRETSVTVDTVTESWDAMNMNNKDPFQWNSNEVTMWLKQQGLFSQSASNLNGRDLLTVAEVEMKESDRFVDGIKKLRLESNSYSLWKFENAINDMYQEESVYSTVDSMRKTETIEPSSDEPSSDESESPVSVSKKKRKPPKKLRKRAKRRKRTPMSISPSSTIEVGRKSVDIIQVCGTYRTNRKHSEHLTVPGDVYESSRNTEGSVTTVTVTEHLYDSEDVELMSS
eukprot:11557_1